MFYPEKRDGYSRIGKLKFDSVTLQTPALLEYNGVPLDGLEMDFGKAPYPVKFISEELYERLAPSNEEVEILTGLKLLSPRQLVQAFEDVRGRGRGEGGGRGGKPIYAVAAAKPSNAALLIYLGADILDNILAISSAYNGMYFLGDYEVELSKLRDLPCNCQYCRSADPEDYEAIAKHNTMVLKQEVEKCKILLAREELRNYVEAKVKLHPDMTATLRIADSGDKTHFPRFRRSRCYFTTMESSNRFEVQYFLKRALECYEPTTDTVLLLPCTAKKPYLLSKTHRRIRSAVKVNVNEIVISSPLVVPREYELLYPAINYDTPVTGQWSDEEIAFVASWLERFLEKGDFQKVIAHVEGGYKKVVERACSDYDVVFTSRIEELRREIEGYDNLNLYERIFSHMLRYQFDVEYRKGRYRGRYPEIEMVVDRARVARVDPVYGRLDVYADLARQLLKEGRYLVEIENFEVTSTIFAAGIVDADERIRPNDIVVFRNDSIAGVGVAAMSGREMVESERGVAINVKRKL